MRIRLALVCCMLFFVSFVYADADVVSDIIIEGLHNVKLKDVLSVVKLKKGKSYSSDATRENVRLIAGLEHFDNVEARFDKRTGVLTFVVSEKPYVEHLVFKGNVEFLAGKLKSTSTLKEKEYHDLAKLEETKSKISTLYKDRGYADCLIEIYSTIDADTNKMTVTFLITENNKIVIGGVKIEGVISYKEKKISRLMKIKPKKIFKENIFNADLAAIEAFYKNNGFMDYQFVSSASTYNEAKTEIFLTLNISEGERYKIGSITHNGNFAVDDKEIGKIIKFKKGQVFDQHKIVEMEQGIKTAYADKGYLNAVINSDFNKRGAESVVDVNLSIQENSIVYVGDIHIDGLVSTKDKVIRREVLLKSGDVFSLKKLSRSIEKIYNLGFIESLECQPMITGAPDVLDLSLAITESSVGTITAGIGYSTVDNLVGSLQIRHMNLLGSGQTLTLLGEFGERKRQSFEIEWTERRIFDKDASLTLCGFDIRRNRDYSGITYAYTERRKGLTTTVGPSLSDYVRLQFGYKIEEVTLSNIRDKIKEEIEKSSNVAKNNITTSVFAQCVYDSRDYIFDPSRGSKQLLYLQLASDKLGGSLNFVRSIAKSTLFFPTFWKFVLSVNMEVGVITAYGGQSVPIYEKFHVGGGGGVGTVRGYASGNEIGPSTGGGKVKGVVNVEYKFPIFGVKGKTILQGAIFYDIGGTWKDFSSVNLTLGDGEKNLRSGVGFSIRVGASLLPMRLDFGYGLNRKENKNEMLPYFSLGYDL
ncbi:MAG: outer membrane protein assembly factor BamA [Endomicrobium sp.]|nr:outer membrane protein assembly factor BamA [Endomicrobium sp.]